MDEKKLQLFKVKEFAAFYRVHYATVYNWIREGKVRYKKIGGCVRIISSLPEDIKENRVTETRHCHYWR